MRKNVLKISVILAIVLSMVLPFTVVNAAGSGTASLKASKTSVAPGEEFTVTLSATDSAGINGLATKYTYSEDILELKDSNVGDSKLSSMGEGNNIEVIANSTDKTNVDVYVLTFKVKADAKEGDKATISTDNISISSFGEDTEVDPQSVTVTVTKATTPVTPTDDKDKDTDKKENDSTDKNSNNSTKNDSSTSKNSTEKTSTSAKDTKSKLPKTGESALIVGGIAIVSVIAIGLYIVIKRYNKI